MTPVLAQAIQEAKQARENAHAPYSKFRVGAAVKARQSERVFPGCNVENASYGLTICAERAAIVSAVAQLGKIELDFVVVVTDQDPPAVPCAACLQVICEFATARTAIHLCSLGKLRESLTLSDLLPRPFVSFTQ